MNTGDLVTYRSLSKNQMFGLVLECKTRNYSGCARWVRVFWHDTLITPPWIEKLHINGIGAPHTELKFEYNDTTCKWHKEIDLEVLHGDQKNV